MGLWYLDFDGTLKLTRAFGRSLKTTTGRRIGRCTTAVTSFSFSGEQEISNLKLFPADMASDTNLRPRLEKAGEHYFDVLRKGSQQVNYDGYSLGKTKRYVSAIYRCQSLVSYSLSLQFKGRVLLDPASYWSYSGTADSPPEIQDLRDNEQGLEGWTCTVCLEKHGVALHLATSSTAGSGRERSRSSGDV